MDWTQLLQGGAGGAMLGSIIPGVGTLLGAGLGTLGGLFGSQGSGSYQDMLKQLAQGYANRQAPQAGPAAQAGYSQFRTNQQGLIAQLEAMAAGHGPSAATAQMQNAMQREAAAQSSAAAGAGGRGVNAGAALRNAANNTMAEQAQTARDTGMMRVNEQLGAVNQLGQTLQGARAGDEASNMFNAGQQNDMARANLEAKLRTLGINDQAQLQAIMAAMGAAGPGFGTQLLAGGASAMPGIQQYLAAQRQQGQGSASNLVGGTIMDPNQYNYGNPNPYGWTPDHG